MQPTPPARESTSFWKSLPGVLTAVAGLLTAAGTLVGGLAAAGFFDSGTDPPTRSVEPVVVTQEADPPAGGVPSPVPPAPSSVPPTGTAAAEPASIDLVYTGDHYGCSLPITVAVGGQSVTPVGNRYTVHGVEPGPQTYTVTGAISCPAAGFCTANGSGVIDVVDGRSYYVSWQNTALGQCTVALNG